VILKEVAEGKIKPGKETVSCVSCDGAVRCFRMKSLSGC